MRNARNIPSIPNQFPDLVFFPFSKPFSELPDTESSGKACGQPHKQLHPDIVTCRHHCDCVLEVIFFGGERDVNSELTELSVLFTSRRKKNWLLFSSSKHYWFNQIYLCSGSISAQHYVDFFMIGNAWEALTWRMQVRFWIP